MRDIVMDGSSAVTVTEADRRAAGECLNAINFSECIDRIAQAIARARRDEWRKGAEWMRERAAKECPECSGTGKPRAEAALYTNKCLHCAIIRALPLEET